MKPFSQHQPLTDAELDQLAEFLKSCKSGKGMNVEQLDGFFAALIAGPETVMPSEYYSEVFGGEMSDTCDFRCLDEANEILGLMCQTHIHKPVMTHSSGGRLVIIVFLCCRCKISKIGQAYFLKRVGD
jgi:tRNA splicing ligase